MLKPDFNSYGARRGNHEVMMRGTFANVRIKNLMLPAKADGSRVEGGVTLFQPGGEQMAIYDAAMKYIAQGTPTVVFGGEEYGTGSSRDWAAKGTQLLGVKAVIVRSFERIHRSNLVGMGVLPCQFKGTDSWESLGIKGDETFDVTGIEGGIKPQMDVTLVIHRTDGTTQGSEGAAAHRHADRGGLLPQRRHPAVRAARTGLQGRVTKPSGCAYNAVQTHPDHQYEQPHATSRQANFHSPRTARGGALRRHRRASARSASRSGQGRLHGAFRTRLIPSG